MKYLINVNGKAVRKGQYVEANTDSGEYILDSDMEEENVVSVAEIMKIAKANGLEPPHGKKKIDKFDSLIAQLEKIEMPEVNTIPETKRVENIVKAGKESGKSDNEILVEIVTSGTAFRKALKLFTSATESLGYVLSTKDRNEKIGKFLEEMDFSPESYQDINDVKEAIVKNISGLEDKEIFASIRKYAKDKGIELPKRPRGVQPGTTGFRGKMFSWMENNPLATEQEFAAYMEENGKSEAATKRFAVLFGVAKKMATKLVEQYGQEKAA